MTEETSAVIARFLAEVTRPNPKGSVRARDLYQAYTRWLEQTSERWPVSEKAFAMEMAKTRTDLERRKFRPGIRYLGIELKEQHPSA